MTISKYRYWICGERECCERVCCGWVCERDAVMIDDHIQVQRVDMW